MHVDSRAAPVEETVVVADGEADHVLEVEADSASDHDVEVLVLGPVGELAVIDVISVLAVPADRNGHLGSKAVGQGRAAEHDEPEPVSDRDPEIEVNRGGEIGLGKVSFSDCQVGIVLGQVGEIESRGDPESGGSDRDVVAAAEVESVETCIDFLGKEMLVLP